jgi:hypothetical protein
VAEPPFDAAAAHRFFASHYFNRAWDFIEKPNRTPDDDEQMIGLAQASLCHWRERPDLTERNLSVGYWQISRVYVLAGRPDEARRYGELSLRHAAGEPPFYAAYAHEAIARAARMTDDRVVWVEHFAKARLLQAQVTDPAEREALERDLADLRGN